MQSGNVYQAIPFAISTREPISRLKPVLKYLCFHSPTPEAFFTPMVMFCRRPLRKKEIVHLPQLPFGTFQKIYFPGDLYFY